MGHEDDATEAGEILVLSFSRAAVRELRERIALHAREARRVRVQTFDSWAYSVLRDEQPDRDWGALRFDERIRRRPRPFSGAPSRRARRVPRPTW